jgi:hypothetical protein
MLTWPSGKLLCLLLACYGCLKHARLQILLCWTDRSMRCCIYTGFTDGPIAPMFMKLHFRAQQLLLKTSRILKYSLLASTKVVNVWSRNATISVCRSVLCCPLGSCPIAASPAKPSRCTRLQQHPLIDQGLLLFITLTTKWASRPVRPKQWDLLSTFHSTLQWHSLAVCN